MCHDRNIYLNFLRFAGNFNTHFEEASSEMNKYYFIWTRNTFERELNSHRNASIHSSNRMSVHLSIPWFKGCYFRSLWKSKWFSQFVSDLEAAGFFRLGRIPPLKFNRWQPLKEDLCTDFDVWGQMHFFEEVLWWTIHEFRDVINGGDIYMYSIEVVMDVKRYIVRPKQWLVLYLP